MKEDKDGSNEKFEIIENNNNNKENEKKRERDFSPFFYDEAEFGGLLKPLYGYYANGIDKNYISITKAENLDAKDKKPSNNGWKFHISIDDSSSDTVKKTWNIIVPILIKHEIVLAKVLKIKNNKNDDTEKKCLAGRQITIYTSRNPTFGIQKWKEILEEITEVLIKNNIKPGYKNYVCKKVTGSNYISYRYDADKNERYFSCEDALKKSYTKKNSKSYNPFLEKDIFKELFLEIQNQPEMKFMNCNNIMDEIEWEEGERIRGNRKYCCCIIN